MIFVGIFSITSNSRISELILSHISIAMCNYNIKFDDINNFTNNYVSKMSVTNSTNSKYTMTTSLDSRQNTLNNMANELLRSETTITTKQDIFNLKLFELFFLKPLYGHFKSVLNQIIKSEEMNLSNIKFKNLYIIDLNTDNIIFDLLRSRNIQKTKDYFKNEKIWQEILYHSQELKNSYLQEKNTKFDMTDSNFRVRKNNYIIISSSNLNLHLLIQDLPSQ